MSAQAAGLLCFAAALSICVGGAVRFGGHEPIGPVFGPIWAAFLVTGVVLTLAPVR